MGGTITKLLAARIRRAFREIPPPGDDIADPQNRGTEPEQVARAFRGRHWSELTNELLLQQPEATAFFSGEALRYFLPGYLLLAIEDADGMDQAFHGFLMSLSQGRGTVEHLSLLTEEQLTVTLAVLEALSPEQSEPFFWEFQHAKDGILECLTQPSSS